MKTLHCIQSTGEVVVTPPKVATGVAGFIKTGDLGISVDGGRVQKGERCNSTNYINQATMTALTEEMNSFPSADIIGASIEPLRYWEWVTTGYWWPFSTASADSIYRTVANVMGMGAGLRSGLWGFPYTPRHVTANWKVVRERNVGARRIGDLVGCLQPVAPLFPRMGGEECQRIMEKVLTECREVWPTKKVWVWLDVNSIEKDEQGLQPETTPDQLDGVYSAIEKSIRLGTKIAGVAVFNGVSFPPGADRDAKVRTCENWNLNVFDAQAAAWAGRLALAEGAGEVG